MSCIRKLWIITLTSLVESIIHGVIDMSILIANPNDCYKITTSYPFDAILWFALRFFEVNFWIWPTIYAFNSRDIVKYQNSRGGRLMSDLTDLEETSIENNIQTMPTRLSNDLQLIGNYNLYFIIAVVAKFDSGIKREAKPTITFNRINTEDKENKSESDEEH